MSIETARQQAANTFPEGVQSFVRDPGGERG